MKQKFYKIFRKSIAARLLLLVSLLVGGGDSVWAQKSLPYSYGFENNDLATEGWTLANSNTGTYATGRVYSNYTSHAGSYYFRFYSNENPPQYLVSPKLSDSSTGLVVSFYYRNAYNGNSEAFCIGYTTNESNSVDGFTWKEEVVCSSTTYTQCEYELPAHTTYFAIKSTTTTASSEMGSNYYLCIDDITVDSNNPYKTPTDYNLNSFTENSATFSWTAGNSETAWQFDYSTDPDFSPGSGINGTSGDITTGDLVDGKYTLSGLTTNTTYYASIRANYGEGNYSEWTEKVAFTPSDESELTINEGSKPYGYAPIYGSYTNSLTRTQLIIPSSSLTSIRNRQITKLTFYTNASDTKYKDLNWGVATFEVYIKPISNPSFNSKTLESWGTKVYNSATVSVSDYKMEITLNTPFNYNDGNLMIGFKQTTTGTYKYASWIGVTGSTNTLLYGYGDNANNITDFNPQITFTTRGVNTAAVQIGTTGFTTFASAWPLDLSTLPDGLTAYYASSQDGSNVTLTKATTEVSAGTGLVLKGTAGQTYAIPVAASGSDISGNLLVGVTSETAVAASATKYVLVNNGGTAEFQSLEDNGATIPAGKAYLNTAGAGARLSILFDDNDNTATSIKNAKTIDKTNIIYNLMGQKVKGSKPGLYIKNGKKVVMK